MQKHKKETSLDAPTAHLSDAGNAKTHKYKENHEAIAAIVRSLPKGQHATAGEVFEQAKQLGLNISLSTVYRTLHRLAQHGNVSTVSGERGLRYEGVEEGEDHDHLICLGCGLTIEFVDDLIRGFGKSVAQRKGFEHKSSRFDILGYCETCNAGDQGRKLEQCLENLHHALDLTEDSSLSLRNAVDFHQSRKFTRGSAAVKRSIGQLRAAIEECENSLLLIAGSNDSP